MKTLLLYARYTDQLSYYEDWVDAFREHPHFDTSCNNVCKLNVSVKKIQQHIEQSDVIILHHSMTADTLEYLQPFVPMLKNRKAVLVSFVGNEVNLSTLGMLPKIALLKSLEVDIIVTQLLQETGEWLYENCNKSRVISLPSALNPKTFYSSRHLSQRTIDIGTRSTRYSIFIGDNDRNAIIQFFHKHALACGLSVDLGITKKDEKRFTRSGWCHFLNTCKATLSTEAGSFYLQRDDRLVNEVLDYLKSQSKKIFISNHTRLKKWGRLCLSDFFYKLMIHFLKKVITNTGSIDESCNFGDIYKHFFLDAPQCPTYSKAISSRHFEAVGTQTLQIMYPGRYNDIFSPGEHFFELKKDHSNMDALIELLKDMRTMKTMSACVYEYVLAHHTYRHRLDTLLAHLIAS